MASGVNRCPGLLQLPRQPTCMKIMQHTRLEMNLIFLNHSSQFTFATFAGALATISTTLNIFRFTLSFPDPCLA